MTAGNSAGGPAVVSSDPQQVNREWWESNPMTYDWEKTLQIDPGTLKWYDEIDRRFLGSAYYAAGQNGQPFGRFLKPDFVSGKQVLEIGCGMGTHAEMLLRNGARLTAIDQTALAVELTRRRLELKQLDAGVLQQDGEKFTVRGLKAELYPIPRNCLKIALERVTPDWLARAILGKFGSMVVVEAIRS